MHLSKSVCGDLGYVCTSHASRSFALFAHTLHVDFFFAFWFWILAQRRRDCVVHSGKVEHAGAAITSGQRLLLVGFIDEAGSPAPP